MGENHAREDRLRELLWEALNRLDLAYALLCDDGFAKKIAQTRDKIRREIGYTTDFAGSA